MAKIWSEPYDPIRHHNPMQGSERPAPIDRHWRSPTLTPHRVVLVRVAGFTFEFHDMEQIRRCLAFYQRVHHPTSRLPVATGDYGGDHSETQRWFERLPLYLREEPKRVRVVAALEQALRRAGAGEV